MPIDSPHQAALIEDLLLIGQGADVVETDIEEDMAGGLPPEGTVAVIRAGHILGPSETLRRGDRLLRIETSGDLPGAG